ncbi:MAG: branched-chain amino acid ABC transporter permease [Candidatus Rokubacteria bacterium]|nr:branched-chain amino acid ABC transporter permease [Candidatus Rokubacteria bacterium]
MTRVEYAAAGVILVGSLLPFWLGHYWLDVAFLAAVYAGIASAWNVAGGFSGTSSFGHGLFFGIGAYTSGALFFHFRVSPWLGLGLGAVLAAAVGVIIAWCGVRYRIRGLSFAVLTLAFAEIAWLFVGTFDPLGASRGISLPPATPGLASLQFQSGWSFFLAGLVFLALCQAVAWRVHVTPLGFRYRAVRENETAAQAMGIDPVFVRLSAMALTAALTAIGGSIYAQYLLFLDPRTFFGPDVTIKVILFTLVGGMGSIWGPVVGTALLYPAGEWLRAAFGGRVPGLDILFYGSLVIVCCLTFPAGIVGTIGRLVGRDGTARASGAPSP